MAGRVKVDVIGPVYGRVISALGCAARQAGHLAGEAAGAVRQWADPDAPERVYHRLSILGRPPKQDQAHKQDQAGSFEKHRREDPDCTCNDCIAWGSKRVREDGDFYQCANCSRIYTAEQLALVDDWWERCEPGETVPDGQCPDESCGALCYWMGEEPTAEYLAYCNEADAPDPRD